MDITVIIAIIRRFIAFRSFEKFLACSAVLGGLAVIFWQ
jgi:hypothetical protein